MAVAGQWWGREPKTQKLRRTSDRSLSGDTTMKRDNKIPSMVVRISLTPQVEAWQVARGHQFAARDISFLAKVHSQQYC
jgi:hypothetical protein